MWVIIKHNHRITGYNCVSAVAEKKAITNIIGDRWNKRRWGRKVLKYEDMLRRNNVLSNKQ